MAQVTPELLEHLTPTSRELGAAPRSVIFTVALLKLCPTWLIAAPLEPNLASSKLNSAPNQPTLAPTELPPAPRDATFAPSAQIFPLQTLNSAPLTLRPASLQVNLPGMQPKSPGGEFALAPT